MKLIGVCGRAQSGKDTFADLVVKEFGGKRIAFADAVKQEVGEMLNAAEVCWEHRHLFGSVSDKEATLRVPGRATLNAETWGAYLTACGEYRNGWWYFCGRTLLQWYGTEYRRAQDGDYWVKRALEGLDRDTLYAVSDCRFPNECAGIKDLGGTTVHIMRKDAPVISGANHISETALDGYMFDYIVINDGSLENYHDQIRKVVRSIINEC